MAWNKIGPGHCENNNCLSEELGNNDQTFQGLKNRKGDLNIIYLLA